MEASTIYLKDWLTLIALIIGPVIAVGITLWFQNRSEKIKAKRGLFLTLMAHRKSAATPDPEWAKALNLISVVFADSADVVGKWYICYDILEQRQAGTPRWIHAHLQLLSAMAKALGYKSLAETDIDKFYIPQGAVDFSTRQAEAQGELIRVLKASHSFSRSSDAGDNPGS